MLDFQEGKFSLSHTEAAFSVPSSPTSSNKSQERHNVVREELTVFLGEFFGTFQFLSMAFAGTQIANESPARISTLPPSGASSNKLPDPSKLVYIAFSFAAALAINAAIFSETSGAMFNPAVTTALLTVGKIRWHRALHSIAAQLIAGILSAALISVLLPGPLPVATSLDPTVTVTRGLFVEAFFTAQLILAVLMLPAGPSKPVYIGIALFIIELGSVYLTGGSVNPVRSFGPAVFVGFDTYHWIYWVGPILGSGFGAGAYTLINLVQNGRLR